MAARAMTPGELADPPCVSSVPILGTAPSTMEEYWFDLRGYTVLDNALSQLELTAINKWVDEREEVIRTIMRTDPIDYMPIEPSISLGGMYVQSYHNGERNHRSQVDDTVDDGVNLQFPYETGLDVFESLIDHESWMDRVRHYLGVGSQPYLHELFLNLRGEGGYIGCHGGGPQFTHTGEILRSPWGAAVHRTGETGHDPHAGQGTHRGHHVQWAVPYLSIIVALNDIGPGDGATVCIPGSHKSLVGHPFQQAMVTEGGKVEGAQEMHLTAGQALLFQDSLVHGAAARVNSDGWRRTLCFRYLPQEYSTDRFGNKHSQNCHGLHRFFHHFELHELCSSRTCPQQGSHGTLDSSTPGNTHTACHGA
eukprot:COSAG02_NODE_3616_length_6473_cov_7.147160_7_plen_365_part_00